MIPYKYLHYFVLSPFLPISPREKIYSEKDKKVYKEEEGIEGKRERERERNEQRGNVGGEGRGKGGGERGERRRKRI